jgi:hypothetical protein
MEYVPRTGPKRMPRENMAMALPRSSVGKRSDIMPDPIVRHAEPPSPAKNRMTMSPSRFGASAQPRLNAQNTMLEILRTIRRP